jgi:hypothetical protein
VCKEIGGWYPFYIQIDFPVLPQIQPIQPTQTTVLGAGIPSQFLFLSPMERGPYSGPILEVISMQEIITAASIIMLLEVQQVLLHNQYFKEET